MGKYILTVLAGYLIGHIQFAIIISKLQYHDDVRKHGSGNAGSTNMLRVYGLKPGLVTFIGDFLKGVAAVLVGRAIAGEVGGYIAAVSVVLGHCYPAFLHFRGGKGVASAFGVIWVVHPLYALIVTATAGALLSTCMISVASLGGATAFLVLVLLFGRDNTPLVIMSVLLWALVTIRHIDNIKRIIKGEENKIFQKKKDAPDAKL